MPEPTTDERSILSWLDFDGPMRLMEIVAMVNPPPTSRRVLWFGGRDLDAWKERTTKVCEAMWTLEDQHLVECVRRRRMRMSCVYGITGAGRVALAAINELSKGRQ